MLRLFTFVFFFASLFALSVEAQTVVINDANARQNLTVVAPGCLSGNTLTLACASAITNVDVKINQLTQQGTVDGFFFPGLEQLTGLKSLTITSSTLFGEIVPPDDWDYDFYNLSANVEVITVNHADNEDSYAFEPLELVGRVTNLPANLKKLSVGSKTLRIDALPSSLKHLELFGGYQYISSWQEEHNINVTIESGVWPTSIDSLSVLRADIILSGGGTPFTGLKYLRITESLTPLAAVPTTLTTLIYNGGAFGFNFPFSTLSTQLVKLDVSSARIQNLPALPSTLQELNLLSISSLSTISSFPASLRKISFQSCNSLINGIPTLPAELTDLSIINMINAKVPPLNSSLRNLKLVNLRLDSIPTLPNGLLTLDVSSNRITSITRAFPSGLTECRLSSNQLLSLPALGNSLSLLDVRSNANLSCLPLLPNTLKDLLTVGTQLTCIPNATAFIAPSGNLPLCTNPVFVCGELEAFFEGLIYIDVNKNNAFDSTDLPVNGAIVTSQPSGRNVVSNAQGRYKILANYDLQNEISITYNNPYLEGISPLNYTLTPPSGSALVDTFDFGIKLRVAKDLEVFLTDNFARPGFTTSVVATLLNRGSQDVSNAQLVLYKPTDWTVESTNPVASQISNDSIVWNDIDLEYLKNKKFNLITRLPATAAILGTPYSYTAKAYPKANDETPENNTFLLTGVVRGSYDPNDKLVNQTTIPPGYDDNAELIYTIRFQNSGTDTAFNVVVKDSILSTLNPTSLRVISASHEFEWTFDENGVAVFTFENILLPDSNVNEPASHGYVMIALKPQSDLPLGTAIQNTAAIYFDFNEPIITNTVSTEVKIISGIYNRSAVDLKVYPNPAKDRFRVEWPMEGEVNISLIDLSGKQIMATKAFGGFMDIPVARLQSGLYIVTVQSQSQIAVAKVVIE